MLNKFKNKYQLKTTVKSYDEFGQFHYELVPQSSIDVTIVKSDETEINNPLFKDVEYIGITNCRNIHNKDIISNSIAAYEVKEIVNSRYTFLLLKKVNNG